MGPGKLPLVGDWFLRISEADFSNFLTIFSGFQTAEVPKNHLFDRIIADLGGTS